MFKFMNDLLVAGSKRASLKKVCSVNIASHVPNRQYLANERILGIGFASFNDQGTIEVSSLKLKDDTDAAEAMLLEQFDAFLKNNPPYICTGFNWLAYDMPLLSIKRARLRNEGRQLWNIANLCECTLGIDLQHSVRYVLVTKYNEGWNYRRIEEVLGHQFMSGMQLAPYIPLPPDNPEAMYDLWKKGDTVLDDRLKSIVFNNTQIVKRLIEVFEAETGEFLGKARRTSSMSSTGQRGYPPKATPTYYRKSYQQYQPQQYPQNQQSWNRGQNQWKQQQAPQGQQQPWAQQPPQTQPPWAQQQAPQTQPPWAQQQAPQTPQPWAQNPSTQAGSPTQTSPQQPWMNPQPTIPTQTTPDSQPIPDPKNEPPSTT
jgi:hypothetical protein